MGERKVHEQALHYAGKARISQRLDKLLISTLLKRWILLWCCFKTWVLKMLYACLHDEMMFTNGDLSDWSSYRSCWRSIWYLYTCIYIYIYIHMYILWSFIIDQSFKFEKGPSWGVLLMVVIARFDVISDKYQRRWSFHNIKCFFVIVLHVYNRYIESTSHPDTIFRRCIRAG